MLKNRYLALSAILLYVALSYQPAAAVGNDGRGLQCPSCNHVCQLSSDLVKEKKQCWNVECKPICIPAVRFPWDKCRTPKRPKLKYVKVLKKHEYECEKCKYQWTPVCADCGRDGNSASGCAPAAKPAETASDSGKQALTIPLPPSRDVNSNSLRTSANRPRREAVARRSISDRRG